MSKKIRVLNHSQSYTKIYVIIKKIFIEIMNKKIRVLNHSQSFRVKISTPFYKYFLRKIALHKHYFNIDKIDLSGTLNFFNPSATLTYEFHILRSRNRVLVE